MAKDGILESMTVGINTDEEVAVSALFPTKDKFRMLQMITELQPRGVTPISVLGVIRRRFSSQVLFMFEEEYRTNQIARDRKGRLELSEVMVGRRGQPEDNRLP